MDFGLTGSGSGTVFDFGSLSLALHIFRIFIRFLNSIWFWFYFVLFSIIRIHLHQCLRQNIYQNPMSPCLTGNEKERNRLNKKESSIFFHFVQMLKKMKSDKLNGRVLEAWWVMGRIYAPRFIHVTNLIPNAKMKGRASFKDQQKIMFLIISLFRPLFSASSLRSRLNLLDGGRCCVRVTKTSIDLPLELGGRFLRITLNPFLALIKKSLSRSYIPWVLNIENWITTNSIYMYERFRTAHQTSIPRWNHFFSLWNLIWKFVWVMGCDLLCSLQIF